jgi:hypothetical protein
VRILGVNFALHSRQRVKLAGAAAGAQVRGRRPASGRRVTDARRCFPVFSLRPQP